MKKIKIVFLILALVFGITAVTATSSVYADTAQQAVCSGIGTTADANGNCTTASGPSVESIIHTAVSLLSYLIGVIAVIMILLGGFKYITSAGNDAAVKSAKSTIMYAIIGLVVAVAAQLVVRYVLTSTIKSTTSSLPIIRMYT